MTLESKIASQLHEDWRRCRQRADGGFESDWHKVNDKAYLDGLDKNNLPANVRVNDGQVEIDVANSDFNQLSPDLQMEHLASAKVIVGVLTERDELTLDQIGEKIYAGYLTRHPKLRSENPVTFSDLSEKQKRGVLRQYRIGLEVLNTCEKVAEHENASSKTMTL